MKKRLNDYAVHHLPHPESGQVDVWDATLPRFGLRIGTRTKTWIFNTGSSRISLGRYPIISLKQARDEAKRRLASRWFPQTSLEAQEAVKRYLAAKQDSHRPGTLSVYGLYLRRLHGPLHEITPQYVYSILPEGKAAANLSFNVFKAFLSWCVERDYIQLNPLLKRRQPNKLKTRDRLISSEEMKIMWHESYNHNSFGNLLRLCFLSGQRVGQWRNPAIISLQDDILTFPAICMKGRIEHRIPATPLIKQHFLQLSPVPHHSDAMTKFRAALPPMQRATIHDTRRFFSSTMASLQPPVPQEVTEKLLAHRTGKLTAIAQVYNRHQYLVEMRDALERYHAHLRDVLNISEHP